MDAQDYTFRAFKVTSQVATPGAESAVCDCLVFPCGCDCTAPVFCILSNGRIINVHYNDDDDDDKVCQFSTTLTDAHYSMSYRSLASTGYASYPHSSRAAFQGYRCFVTPQS